MPSRPEDDDVRKGPSFIVDGMLGDVARWLRIMGYDTLYLSDADDEEILRASANRILLTSDEELYRRAIKHGTEAFLLPEVTLLGKLRSVSRRYDLSSKMSGSRCTACNGTLVKATPENIPASKDILPIHVDEVWSCTGCGKLYWRGSHWKGIERTLREVTLPPT